MFDSEPSEYVWHDANGVAHLALQAEGGEQGDPLMLALRSLWQPPALRAANAELPAGECVAALFDDTYALTAPERAGPAFQVLSRALPHPAQPRKRHVCGTQQGGVRPTSASPASPTNRAGQAPFPQRLRGWLCSVCLWVQMLLCRPSSYNPGRATMRSCSACRNLRASKPLGSCCLFVVFHVASTCFACCPCRQQTPVQACVTVAIVSALAELPGRDSICHYAAPPVRPFCQPQLHHCANLPCLGLLLRLVPGASLEASPPPAPPLRALLPAATRAGATAVLKANCWKRRSGSWKQPPGTELCAGQALSLTVLHPH